MGWTAVPMAYENMTIIEGKLKLPMLKGDHNSSIQHFKDMEKAMASDLSSWLCNIYLEVLR